MATEFKLNYTGSEINRKLATVDEVKSSLENDYYTSVEVDDKIIEVNDNIDTKIGDVNTAIVTSLSNYYTKTEVDKETNAIKEEVDERFLSKADLVDGKIPIGQLPDDIGGGLTEVDWETNIINKPFYDNSVNIQMPNDISGCTTISSQPLSFADGLSFTFIKVSDAYFNSANEMINNIIGIDFQMAGVNFDVTIQAENINEMGNGNFGTLFVVDESVFPVCMSIASVGSCAFPTANHYGEDLLFNVVETGIYLAYVQGMCVATNLIKNDIKQIDPKFIPANLDFDLSDYYTKAEIDELIGDVDTVLDEINGLIGE